MDAWKIEDEQSWSAPDDMPEVDQEAMDAWQRFDGDMVRLFRALIDARAEVDRLREPPTGPHPHFTFWHLDGTQCVAGWHSQTGECVNGGGLVTPRERGQG